MTIDVPMRPDQRGSASHAKFYGMPRLQNGRIDKPRLSTRLQRPTALTVVRAPHGFGKSMLVAQWLRSLADDDIDVLWFGYNWDLVSTEESVKRFWDLLATRLEELNSAARKASAVKGLNGRERVFKLLSERSKPIYVVLDKYSEQASAASGVDQDLTDLVRSSENLFLIVCTRDVTSLEIVGAAMVDSLVLRPADLLLGPEEVISLAAQDSISLSREDAVALCRETGGWPTLVRVVLTGSAAQQRPGEPFQVNLDTGRWYLRTVWNDFADPAVKHLVDRTGFIGDFTIEAAHELCEDIDPKSAINELVTAGLLGARTGNSGTTYSHLPAVRREVRDRLQREEPKRYEELSLQAANLYQARGQLTKALAFLVRAELWEQLLQLVDSAWGQLSVHHAQELVRMTRIVPEHVLYRSPHLVAVLGQIGDKAGAQDSSRELGSDADLALGSSMLFGDAGADVLKSQSPPGPLARVSQEVQSQLATVLYEWAVARMIESDPVGALNLFEEAHGVAVRYTDGDMIAASSVGAALVNALIGEIAEADKWLGESSVAGSGSGRVLPSGSSLPDLLQIVSAYVSVGKLSDRDSLLKVKELSSQHEADDLWALSLTLRAQAAIFAGEQFNLLEEFDQHHDRLAYRSKTDLLSVLVVSARVDLLLSLGQVFRARAVLNTVDPEHIALVATRARVAYLAGDYSKAVLMASQALHDGLRLPRLRLGVLLVLASAEAARGRRTETIQALQEAVTVSAESGFRTYFSFAPRAMLREYSSEVPGLAAILDHLEMQFADDVFPAPSVIAELSEREREVLVELASSRTLAGVARALYLTTNTVKTHLRSIYRKLGTHSANETIQRAVECGLIEPPEQKLA